MKSLNYLNFDIYPDKLTRCLQRGTLLNMISLSIELPEVNIRS